MVLEKAKRLVEMGDDVVERAAVQTLLNNGAVYAMPDLPGEEPLAAVFRY